ncbi:MAG: T9SS type A sorting domain-containing protein [Bacteroidota bacterium]
MKKTLLIITLFFIATSLFSQTVWNEVWNLKEAPFRPADSGSDYTKVVAGFDTDEDGWGEFITGYTDFFSDSNYVFMYEATGDNTYEVVWYWKMPAERNSYFGVTVGDADHNGNVEIIIGLPTIVSEGDPNPARVFTFEWNGVQGENKYGRENGDGSFSSTSETHFDIPDMTDWRPYSMTLEDIDKDGVNELVVGVRAGGRGREVLVASVVGGDLSAFGQWTTEYSYQYAEGGSNYCTVTGDLDNDGNTDIIELVWNMYTIRFFEVTGPDTYEYQNGLEKIFSPVDHGSVDGVCIVDVNGDGKNEMLHASTDAETIYLIENVTDLAAITADDIVEIYHPPVNTRPNGTLTDGGMRRMVAGDPDQDGKLNLLIAGGHRGQVLDLEYKGEGDLADSTSWELSIAYDCFAQPAIEIGADSASILTPRIYYGDLADDMDGDGKSEFVLVNYSTDKEVWENDIYIAIVEADQATSVEPTDKLIPETLELSQNYPNPFNPATKINFAVPENSGHVKLAVYDILGRVITTLVDEELSSGNYSVDFDASNLPSGIYMYRLSSGSNTQTMKMILQK